jgi:hypothetical protein
MPNRTGSADLPLHSGRVPSWLATRMATLGRVIVEAIVQEYGTDELLRRLAHPFWFQCFGAVMGMDWHSSGITTSVVGALKRGLAPISDELGVYVCGGRGRHSRQTPAELLQIAERTGLDAASLTRASRLVAKVDSAAVQDGYDLYLHAFIVTRGGDWCVVQQGMNDLRREARRYHWLSENLPGFFESPHAAIEGRNGGVIVNLADARAHRNRRAELEIARAGPDRAIRLLRQLRNATLPLFPEALPTDEFNTCRDHEVASVSPGAESALLPRLQLPAHHAVEASDVMLRRLHGVLAAAAERGPKDFAELLLTPGVGARTVAALAMVAEVVHGAPARFSDPARFSLALGGKDGHPFPVPLRVYDETIAILKSAVTRAKLGQSDRLHAIRRLDRHARTLERLSGGPSFEQFVAGERARSREYAGRIVYDRH